MFRLRDLLALAIVLVVMTVPDETSPAWIRPALLGLALAIVAEVAWELFRRRSGRGR